MCIIRTVKFVEIHTIKSDTKCFMSFFTWNIGISLSDEEGAEYWVQIHDENILLYELMKQNSVFHTKCNFIWIVKKCLGKTTYNIHHRWPLSFVKIKLRFLNNIEFYKTRPIFKPLFQENKEPIGSKLYS